MPAPRNKSKSNLGKRFESLIEAANRQYLITDRAVIEKQEVQNKFINGKMIYSDKGAPDFMGAIAGGRAVVFDAKSTGGQSLPLKNITRRRHQLEFLNRMDKLGALAFYLVEFTDHNRYFVLTMSQVNAAIYRAEQQDGRKSIALHEFTIEIRGSWDNALNYLEPFIQTQKERIK